MTLKNVPARMDAQTLMPAVKGHPLILFQASRASDLNAIMDFKEENRALRIAIVGADEGRRQARRLAALDIPVIVDAFLNLSSSFSQLAATSENAKRRSQAGVTVAIAHLENDGRSRSGAGCPKVNSRGLPIGRGFSGEAARTRVCVQLP